MRSPSTPTSLFGFSMVRPLLCLAWGFLLSACQSTPWVLGQAHPVQNPANSPAPSALNAQNYWGWLRIQAPENAHSTSSPAAATRVTGFGLRWGMHNSLGYFDEIRFSVPPGCRIVLMIQNEKEASSVRDFLNQHLKESPCSVLSPS